MPSIRSLFSTLVVSTAALAAPLNEINERSDQFSVHQTRNAGFKEVYGIGPAALAKAYGKYAKNGAVMPNRLVQVVSAAKKNGRFPSFTADIALS